MTQIGIGAMLQSLGGNEEAVKTVQKALGKTIKKVWLDKENDTLNFEFKDGSKMKIWDGGQNCCEHRYMTTDEELSYYEGSKLLDLELKDCPEIEEDDDVHEVQFLDVKTDTGVFQMANHNEHNGYYGGFRIQASEL